MKIPDPQRPIYLATRGSLLALAQANQVLGHCQAAFPELRFELRIMKTTGDKLLSASLANPELPKGLFTKELEVALLNGEADLAVHSLKDLPTDLPSGLKLGAVSQRVDVRDVLVYRASLLGDPPARIHNLGGLPKNSTVATSSTRREAQLLEKRPDVKAVPIRGNVGTRLRKLAEQEELSATLLAAAGIERLGIRIKADGRLEGEGVPDGLLALALEPSEMLPCVGQAALGFETREGNAIAEALCAGLNHPSTQQCVMAERAFLKAMGGGCHLAVAALAERRDQDLHLRGISYLSAAPRRGEVHGPAEQAEALGRQLAEKLQCH